MTYETSEAVIDEIVATCNGDLRGAVRALMLINEQLEQELQRAYATGQRRATRATVLH